MHGCGNSFLIVDEYDKKITANKKKYAIEHADREQVDGVLFVGKSSERSREVKMEIFDRDGTEENMCGNGLRCIARYSYDCGYIGERGKIVARDGIKNVEINEGLIKVYMGKPREFRDLGNDWYFVFTGIPHLVLIQKKLDLANAKKEGRRLRYDKGLCGLVKHPEGVCVNFVKRNSDDKSIDILTYETGVEDVTSACGTGSTASAYVSHIANRMKFPIQVKNIGGNLTIDSEEGELTMTGPAEYL